MQGNGFKVAECSLIKSWGAVPVTLEWSECYEAMRNNLVEGLYADGAAAALFHMQDVIDYYTYCPMYNDVHMVLISEQGMAKLPKVMQDALLEASEKIMQEHCIPVVPSLGIMAPVFTEFFAGINEVAFLPNETLEEMRELSSPVLSSYVEQLNGKGYDGQEALDTFLSYVEEYNKEWPAETVVAEFANYSDNIWTGE